MSLVIWPSGAVMLKIFAFDITPLKGSIDRYTNQQRYDTGFAILAYDRNTHQLNCRDMRTKFILWF